MMRRIVAVAGLLGFAELPAHPEIEQALARLNAEIAARPTDAELYVARGELYGKHAAWDLAEANFLVAGELSPDHPRLLRLRGALALAQRQHHAARTLLDAALARDPHDTAAMVWRARTHLALGAPAAALADLDATLVALPNPPPELFLERATLLPAAVAIQSLDAAIARIGPALALQLRAVTLEESLGRIDAAAARLAGIAAQSERRETWLKRRGDVLARAGRRAEALAAYTAALDAIAALPDWLRASPDTAQLAGELHQLVAAGS